MLQKLSGIRKVYEDEAGVGRGEGQGWSVTSSLSKFVVSHYRKTS